MKKSNMNNITVPKQYKHMIKQQHDPAGKLNKVIKHIKENEGKILRLSDFDDVIGGTTGAQYVRKLIKDGQVLRHKHRGYQGHAYSYEYLEKPLDMHTAALKSGKVIVTKLNLPDVPFTSEQLDKLTMYFAKWIDSSDEITGQDIRGAKNFRTYLKDICTANTIERDAKLGNVV